MNNTLMYVSLGDHSLPQGALIEEIRYIKF